MSIAFIINLIMALVSPLHDDEAYYWFYSLDLDWGYFDHPPMIALFIKMGTLLFGKTLIGVRIIGVLASALLYWFIHHIQLKFNPEQKPGYTLLFYLSVPILGVYGFISTPDVPMLLFGAIWLNLMLSKEQSWQHVFTQAIVAAALVYSKYHGGIFILLTLPLLFKKNGFLKAVVVGTTAIAFFIPHIIWQYNNDFPSFTYHLVDRYGGFNLNFFLNYLISPFVVMGVLFLVVDFRKYKYFLFALLLLFIVFIFPALKGRVEAHWLAIGSLLLIPAFSELSKRQFRILAAHALLLVIARIAFPFTSHEIRGFKKTEPWALSIEDSAKGLPVVFINSYKKAAKYMFYTNGKAISENNTYGRKNQFNLIENSNFDGDPVFLVSPYGTIGLSKLNKSVYGKELSNFQTANGLSAKLDSFQFFHKKHKVFIELNFTFKNLNQVPYSLIKSNLKPAMNLMVLKNGLKPYEKYWNLELENDEIKSGGSVIRVSGSITSEIFERLKNENFCLVLARDYIYKSQLSAPFYFDAH
jgi:hypothetical protein